jgi:hypothetical protein
MAEHAGGSVAGSVAGSLTGSVASAGDVSAEWPSLPTETDIYILPDGRVVIADLPAELAGLAVALGAVESCEIAPDAESHPPV